MAEERISDLTNLATFAAGYLLEVERESDAESLHVTTDALISYLDTHYATAAQGALADTAVQTETDPVFAASAAYGIAAGDITNWDTAYSWGDHASAGYLTSYTETDPIVGAISGLVKADGAGNISAATADTDYLTPATASSTYLLLTGGKLTGPLAIDNGAVSNGGAVSAGASSVASNINAIALGGGATATSSGGIAIGLNATAEIGLSHIAAGANAYVAGIISSALGSNTAAYGQYTGAFGIGCTVGTASISPLFAAAAGVGVAANHNNSLHLGTSVTGAATDAANQFKVTLINASFSGDLPVIDARTGASSVVSLDLYGDLITANGGLKVTGELGLFNTTPIAQPTPSTGATFVAGSGTGINDDSTFDGWTIPQAIRALRNLGALS